MTTATDIASYINSRVPWAFDNTKTQKLVYFANAWSLAWTARPLTDETFVAFVNGPVEFELWKTQRYSWIPTYEGQLDDESKLIVDSVLAHYSGLTTTALVNLSHEEPWNEARGGLAPNVPSRNPLKVESIRSYYTGLQFSGQAPKRLARVEEAPVERVGSTAKAAAERWKDALEILASR